MKVHQKHNNITQNMHGASRNYRYVWDISGDTKEVRGRRDGRSDARSTKSRRWWGLGRRDDLVGCHGDDSLAGLGAAVLLPGGRCSATSTGGGEDGWPRP